MVCLMVYRMMCTVRFCCVCVSYTRGFCKLEIRTELSVRLGQKLLSQTVLALWLWSLLFRDEFFAGMLCPVIHSWWLHHDSFAFWSFLCTQKTDHRLIPTAFWLPSSLIHGWMWCLLRQGWSRLVTQLVLSKPRWTLRETCIVGYSLHSGCSEFWFWRIALGLFFFFDLELQREIHVSERGLWILWVENIYLS